VLAAACGWVWRDRLRLGNPRAATGRKGPCTLRRCTCSEARCYQTSTSVHVTTYRLAQCNAHEVIQIIPRSTRAHPMQMLRSTWCCAKSVSLMQMKIHNQVEKYRALHGVTRSPNLLVIPGAAECEVLFGTCIYEWVELSVSG